MKRFAWLFALVLMVGFLPGCGTSGNVIVPQTNDQRVYVAYGTYVSLVNTAADMVELGTLDKAHAVAVQAKFQAIRPQLDHLKSIVDRGLELPANELETLQLIQKMLIELQIELQQRSVS